MKLGATFRLFLYLLFVVIAGTLFLIWNDLQAVRRVLARAEGPAPPLVIASIVAAEDPDFFQHSRYYTGPSLDSQLVKWNVQERGFTQPLREVLISAIVELTQSKETVANAYATNVYLGTAEGEPLYGVERAAHAYFGVDWKELLPEQAASLAATIRSPTLFSPSASSERAVSRRLEILQGMLRAGAITQAQFDHARDSKVTRGIGGAVLK